MHLNIIVNFAWRTARSRNMNYNCEPTSFGTAYWQDIYEEQTIVGAWKDNVYKVNQFVISVGEAHERNDIDRDGIFKDIGEEQCIL